MRGGNNRASTARRTAAARRRRGRFTAERVRDPWGYKRPDLDDDEDFDDDTRAAR
jgi:hypothetical protein